MNDAAPARVEGGIRERLRGLPFFLEATEDELAISFAAYRAHAADGDAGPLVDAWLRSARPLRARLDGAWGVAFGAAHRLPLHARRRSFLATTRGVLAAGRRVRERLRPAARAVIERDFPWLEGRHAHLPDGWAAPVEFPAGFVEFVDGAAGVAGEGGDAPDAVRLRWHLVTALNEVQAHAGTIDLARRFALPELFRHAAVERALALRYFAEGTRRGLPRATERLWREAVHVLDALNAAVYAALCGPAGAPVAARCLLEVGAARREWAAFLRALDAAGV